MTRPCGPRQDSRTIPEVVWERAKQLRRAGLGPERIARALTAEGWPVIPTRNVIGGRMEREGWDGPALRIGPYPKVVRVPEPEPTVDDLYLSARKRCETCWGVGTGETCPNGHIFPLARVAESSMIQV